MHKKQRCKQPHLFDEESPVPLILLLLSLAACLLATGLLALRGALWVLCSIVRLVLLLLNCVCVCVCVCRGGCVSVYVVRVRMCACVCTRVSMCELL
jgi:hypothetical protein